jgi:hypothetical protein
MKAHSTAGRHWGQAVCQLGLGMDMQGCTWTVSGRQQLFPACLSLRGNDLRAVMPPALGASVNTQGQGGGLEDVHRE